jgi:hypothetical protein
MFGRNNGNDENDGPRQPTAADIPPPRTLIVNELTLKRDGSEAWGDISYQGHSIQTTEAGGINILRIVFMPGMGPVQQMVVGLPPGRWRRIYENIDLGATSPLSIH